MRTPSWKNYQSRITTVAIWVSRETASEMEAYVHVVPWGPLGNEGVRVVDWVEGETRPMVQLR